MFGYPLISIIKLSPVITSGRMGAGTSNPSKLECGVGQLHRVVTAHCTILDTVRTAVTGDRALDNHEQILVQPVSYEGQCRHWSTFCARCVQSTISKDPLQH